MERNLTEGMLDGYETIRDIAGRNGLPLDDVQVSLLREYEKLLRHWNLRVNLVSRADTQNIWSNHILHSLSILFVVDLPTEARVLDLGTGGGLPGIPIAIARPDVHMTLLDSIRKKTVAVEDIVSRLGLSRCTVVTSRVESLPEEVRSQQYGVILARAVAPLKELVRWSVQLASRGRSERGAAMLIALKGGDLEDEVSEARRAYPGMNVSVLDLRLGDRGGIELTDKKIIIVNL